MITDTRTVAKMLAKTLDTQTLADVIGSLLSSWDNREDIGLTDEQASVAECVFAELCYLRPNAVEVAQGTVKAVSHADIVREMEHPYGWNEVGTTTGESWTCELCEWPGKPDRTDSGRDQCPDCGHVHGVEDYHDVRGMEGS